MSELMNYGSWGDVPDNLKTKTGLSKMGLRLGKGQKVAAHKTHWDYSVPTYALYDVGEAVPKRTMTAAQKGSLERARAAALVVRSCERCGRVEGSKIYRTDGRRHCERCIHGQMLAAAKQMARDWARQMLMTEGAVILDTETTGLNGEVIELAVIDMAGNELFNRRFRPLMRIEPGATAVHGLTAEMLKEELDFCLHYDEVSRVLADAAVVVIYNAAFDLARLAETCEVHKLAPLDIVLKGECAMEKYAAFVGDWSDYHESFRWQPLLGGDHSAVGDCRATLAVLREMAAAEREIPIDLGTGETLGVEEG